MFSIFSNKNLPARMKFTKTSSVFALLTLALHAFPHFAKAAEQQVITLKDWTGRGFAPDLVNYTIPAPADGGKKLRVLDSAGVSLPVQITPGEKGQATLSFVASLPASGESVYKVSTESTAPTAKPAVTVTKDGEALVLANQLLAVKVPAPLEKTYDKPVPADTLPAPILAFRGPDGSWRGAGSILTKRAVSKISVTQLAAGPVFVETKYRLDYAEGGYYEASVRVTDQAPFAKVTEEFDLGVGANANFWQLDLSKGWAPDAAEHMFVAGQNHGSVVYPTLAEEEKAAASGPSVGAAPSATAETPTRLIHHDSCWGSRFVSYYGVHQAEARKANPDTYPLAIVAPLHKGSWRRANSLPVYVKGGNVTVRFPMDVAPLSWLNEPVSDVSPFSCHEHDPSLAMSVGRREWALVLAKPAMLVDGYGNKDTLGIGYAVRNLYGTVGLDRYKDFILTWPDSKVAYPRVFITPELANKYRAAVQADPNFPLMPMLKDYYWFTGDPVVAQKELTDVQKRLGQLILYPVSALSMGHHHATEFYGAPLGHTESVLSWPDLSTADREQIRARLALLAYLLTDPDTTSAGDGSHHGNPNMGVARLSDRANLVAMIPDHPRFNAWRDYVGQFTSYKIGSFMAPGGGWFEYGASYHMHGYGKILRGLMGVFSSNATDADVMAKYNRVDMDYYVNLLSPVDSRYGSRTIPGMANSPVGQSPHYLQAMGTVADKDPALAANLRWAWDNNGRMVGTGADSVTIPAMVRPEIAAKEPKLTSQIYPGFGVIFRAHQGPDETCLYLRSGYLWSHWTEDQGNLTLYSKGAVLLPPQPYQYGGPKDKTFPDKNLLRFGSPANDSPHAWVDSNILDAHFGPSVDYAWASSGYPDWFINPGFRPGHGKPRDLVAGLNQKEGAFTWDRQIAFLKGATGKSPNYFVIRDSMNGAGKLASWFNLSLLGRKENVKIEGGKIILDTEWPTKLDLLFMNPDKPTFEMAEDNLPLAVGAYTKFSGDLTEGKVPSRDWIGEDGKPKAVGKDMIAGFKNAKEQHVSLRLQSAPGQEVAWVLYPRGAGEAAPTATPLAPGVTKVVTSESTDYIFLSTTPIKYADEGVEFEGCAGAVRVAKDGKATLVLSAGPGKAGYKGSVIESAEPFEKVVSAGQKAETIPAPQRSVGKAEQAVTVNGDKIRFAEPGKKYVELTHGNVGVRGVGPFDLTFTPDGITGEVDGDIRTIVTTWPEKIIRPGFRMDGVRWYAGFSDEHSFVKGTSSPQFAIAMGLSAGHHTVKISEWEWPALPEAPARTELLLK
jgi:hypothetical protein